MPRYVNNRAYINSGNVVKIAKEKIRLANSVNRLMSQLVPSYLFFVFKYPLSLIFFSTSVIVDRS